MDGKWCTIFNIIYKYKSEKCGVHLYSPPPPQLKKKKKRTLFRTTFCWKQLQLSQTGWRVSVLLQIPSSFYHMNKLWSHPLFRSSGFLSCWKVNLHYSLESFQLLTGFLSGLSCVSIYSTPAALTAALFLLKKCIPTAWSCHHHVSWGTFTKHFLKMPAKTSPSLCCLWSFIHHW